MQEGEEGKEGDGPGHGRNFKGEIKGKELNRNI
jgi:hypothetical protein